MANVAAKNHYETLGVGVYADKPKIKSAYRELVLKTHPDQNPGDVSAGSKFIAVREAYLVLKDPVKRSTYNRELLKGMPFEILPFGSIVGVGVGGWPGKVVDFDTFRLKCKVNILGTTFQQVAEHDDLCLCREATLHGLAERGVISNEKRGFILGWSLSESAYLVYLPKDDEDSCFVVGRANALMDIGTVGILSNLASPCNEHLNGTSVTIDAWIPARKCYRVRLSKDVEIASKKDSYMLIKPEWFRCDGLFLLSDDIGRHLTIVTPLSLAVLARRKAERAAQESTTNARASRTDDVKANYTTTLPPQAAPHPPPACSDDDDVKANGSTTPLCNKEPVKECAGVEFPKEGAVKHDQNKDPNVSTATQMEPDVTLTPFSSLTHERLKKLCNEHCIKVPDGNKQKKEPFIRGLAANFPDPRQILKREPLGSFTLSALQKKCECLHIDQSGSKRELIGRLTLSK